MSQTERRVLLVEAATLAVPHVLERLGLPLDTCILACAALGDALRQLDCGRTEAVPVSMICCNPAMTRAVLELGRMPTVADMRALLDADPERFTIGIAPGARAERPNRWDGHVVLAWQRRLLLDPTLGQAARPQHGLELGPLVTAGPGAEFVDGLARGKHGMPAQQGGSLVIYWPLRGATAHLTSAHWQPTDPTRQAVATAIKLAALALIEAAMDAAERAEAARA